MPKRLLAEELKVRVNPHYDHDVDPEQNEFGFWNPVSVTNDLVKLANAVLEVTQEISVKTEERQRQKKDRRKAERRLESIESELLADDKLSPTEAKTLKTVAAAIHARARKSIHAPEYEALTIQLGDLEERIGTLDAELDVLHEWNKTAEKIGDNLKTALSFYKDERRREYGR
jgi:hypothetical protein